MNEVTFKTRSFPPPERTDDSECSICLETFDSSKRSITTTECHHTFDSDCLAKWVTHKPRCPLCDKMLSDRSVVCGMSREVVPAEPICSICQDCLECPNRPVSTTPCRHSFHSNCLSHWSYGKPAPFCPVCRTPIPKSRAPESRLFLPPPIDSFETEDVCTICTDFLSRARVIMTPCRHYFHAPCLRWFIDQRPFEAFCPYCRAPLQAASTRSPMTRDSGHDSLSIPDRALSDAANPPAGENTNTAGRGYVVIEIPESDDHEVDSNDVLPTRFIRRRRGRTESCCQIL